MVAQLAGVVLIKQVRLQLQVQLQVQAQVFESKPERVFARECSTMRAAAW